MTRSLWRTLHIDWRNAPVLDECYAYTDWEILLRLKLTEAARWRVAPTSGGISSSIERSMV